MSSFSLRALGMMQFAYELLGLLRGRLTFGDLRGTLRPVVIDCVVRGHVDLRMYYGVDDGEHAVLGNVGGLIDDVAVLRAAHDATARFMTLGRERGGYLPSFVGAADWHLIECVHCQKAVCDSVRCENRGRRSMKALLLSVGIDAEYMRNRPSRKVKRNLRSV